MNNQDILSVDSDLNVHAAPWTPSSTPLAKMMNAPAFYQPQQPIGLHHHQHQQQQVQQQQYAMMMEYSPQISQPMMMIPGNYVQFPQQQQQYHQTGLGNFPWQYQYTYSNSAA